MSTRKGNGGNPRPHDSLPGELPSSLDGDLLTSPTEDPARSTGWVSLRGGEKCDAVRS